MDKKKNQLYNIVALLTMDTKEKQKDIIPFEVKLNK